MTSSRIETKSLTLIPNTLDDVRALIDGMDAEQSAELSPEWLARINAGTADQWTLGFTIVHRDTGATVGSCGFKGPPGADGIVEIAYGVSPKHEGKGYATQAAAALVVFAFDSGMSRVVRAHTFSEGNASASVLAKCGFQPVGEVIDPEDGVVWRWETQRS